MRRHRAPLAALAVAGVLLAPAPARALPHDPAVSRTCIAFIEGGQIWLMKRGGSTARRLTATPGNKFTPRFSPDGEMLAFGANDAPNQNNLHTIPIAGGAPSQVTFLPSQQALSQWMADGRLLFHTSALSFSPIEMQLFTVSAAGGLPVQLPPAYGSDGAIDATGEWLAYTPQWRHQLIAGWKRYRGGAAPDIWLFNLKTRASRRLTDWEGSDLRPMWDGSTLYYLSDAGPEQRMNLWAWDMRVRARRQVTRLRDDVRNPSIGPGAIVFESGPDLHLLDLRGGRVSRLKITMPKSAHLAPRRDVEASRFITNRQDAGGGRLLLEARGDLWLAGGTQAPRNLTATSGVFERESAVSPDGGRVAYWSDATGEYELYVRVLAGPAPPGPLTRLGAGFRQRPVWSGDGRRLAYVDQTGAIAIFDVERKAVTRADVEPWAEPTELAWSPDGGWLAYTRTGGNRLTAIWRYDTATGQHQQLTADAFNASTPVFTPGGEKLFFISNRNFTNPVSDWIQQRIAHRDTGVLMSVPLRGVAFEAGAFERAASRVATGAGSFTSLGATHDGDPIYGLADPAGAVSLRVFELAAGKERVILEGTGDVVVSRDGLRLVVVRDGKTMVRSVADAAATEVRTDGMMVSIDTMAEWRQIFDDAWRLYRDYFHAPKQPLSGWDDVKARYASMLARCVTREEVNLVLSEMIGETSVGHAYLAGPGDVSPPPSGTPTAMLGADLVLENGAFRISRILEAAPWDDTVRSPLRDARQGEYVLAVDGVPLDLKQDPRRALAGKAGKQVTLTIGPHPSLDAAARRIVVTPLANERELRRRSWVEGNRRKTAEASGGRIGYVHIPDFNVNGWNEFARQYYGQIDKEALVIDARWSLGGWLGAHLAELLARKELNHASSRYTDQAWPAPRWGAHFGAKTLIVNHITVSAGENFSYYFRKLGLGPIIGARTWGGLTGLVPVPSLIDGGAVNVPNAPFFDDSGWLIEGRGLEPDALVEWDPGQSEDPQLAAAITRMLAAIGKP